ncbi:hypothetical protein FHS10_003930 [Mucilaginibacter dorajii]|nr:hypothetical protein [Mucilaginibacter dorajii]
MNIKKPLLRAFLLAATFWNDFSNKLNTFIT